jgi:hypothetical protein
MGGIGFAGAAALCCVSQELAVGWASLLEASLPGRVSVADAADETLPGVEDAGAGVAAGCGSGKAAA